MVQSKPIGRQSPEFTMTYVNGNNKRLKSSVITVHVTDYDLREGIFERLESEKRRHDALIITTERIQSERHFDQTDGYSPEKCESGAGDKGKCIGEDLSCKARPIFLNFLVQFRL